MKNNLTDTQTAEILRDKIIEFPEGLPGFPASHEFVMAQEPEEKPFAWMQSVNEPNLKFAIVDAYAWDRDFMLEVDDHALEEMGSLDPLDYAVYFILHIQKRDSRTTLEAKPNSPLLVNVRNRQARQLVTGATASVGRAEALCLQL
jgi:flagellar assembly factor FliW